VQKITVLKENRNVFEDLNPKREELFKNELERHFCNSSININDNNELILLSKIIEKCKNA